MNSNLEYMKSVDFQAAYTVYQKNKRLMDLDHLDLLRLELVSYYLSESRKESGKSPNVDYLVQEVGNWLNGQCKDQEFLDSKIKLLENYVKKI